MEEWKKRENRHGKIGKKKRYEEMMRWKYVGKVEWKTAIEKKWWRVAVNIKKKVA